VRILSLVQAYAAHLGIADPEIRFTGLRPGEKLNESLFSAAEDRIATAHPRISAARSPAPGDEFEKGLKELCAAAEANEVHRVRDCLARLLPDYTPPVAVAVPAPREEADWPYPDGF